MKTKLWIALLASAFCIVPNSYSNQVLKWVVTVITGAAAAESFARADSAWSVFQDKKAVTKSLLEQGIDPSNGAIYSLYLNLSNDVSSVYWADVVNKPDIFAMVQIEGQGSFLVPEVYNEYAGFPILERVIAKNCRPGSRIVVHILDDDSFSNAVWNQILQTRVSCRFGAQVLCAAAVSVSVGVNGSISLLGSNVTIDAPDYVATAEFQVPKSDDGHWIATGLLQDSAHRPVGKLQFGQVWRSPGLFAGGGSRSTAIWWGVIGLVALAVTVKLLIQKTAPKVQDG